MFNQPEILFILKSLHLSKQMAEMDVASCGTG